MRQKCAAMLVLPVEPDRERAGAAARLWFELCSARLLGELGAAVRAEASGRQGGFGALVGTTLYPPDGYQGSPGEWDAEYSPRAWAELLRRAVTLPDNTVFEAYTLDGRGERGRPWVVGSEVGSGFAELSSDVDDALANDAAGQQLIRATVREVAEIGAPVAVAVSEQLGRSQTPLERALQRSVTKRAEAASVLRNYGWLTVLNEEMTDRVGGLSRLRAGGAFVEAEPLAAGGTWLVATETWDEYGPEQANRLFELLAPVLPPGKPSLTQFGAPLTPGGPQLRIELPNVVAERDPREVIGQRL